jgi:phage/plasmid-associated DNA primase
MIADSHARAKEVAQRTAEETRRAKEAWNRRNSHAADNGQGDVGVGGNDFGVGDYHLEGRRDHDHPQDDDQEVKHSGQLAMAVKFAAFANGQLIFVHGIGWHHWDGMRWKQDESGATQRMLYDFYKSEWKAAYALPKMERDRAIQEIKRCESSGGIEGVLKIARTLSQFATVANDLDADPYLLNCANGTLDLSLKPWISDFMLPLTRLP